MLDATGAVRARWMLSQRLRDAPEDHALWAALSLTWFEEGQVEASLDAADRAQQRAPACGLVRWYRANLYSALGREAQARALFRAVVDGAERRPYGACRLDPVHARQMLQKAEVWLELDARGARRMPEPLLRLEPVRNAQPARH